MLDIKFIRENPELVQTKIKQKNCEIDVGHVLEIDEQYRKRLAQMQQLHEERNKASKAKDIEKGKAIKQKLDREENDVAALKQELDALLIKIPNLPDDDVPVGKDETENQEIRKWGEPKQFNFEVKDHVDIGKSLGIIDIETASEVTGSRFAYLKGDAVLLQFALINFAFGVLQNQEIIEELAAKVDPSVSKKVFVPVVPPVMIRPEVYTKMARLDPDQEIERYFLQRDDVYLIGSAEHTLGPMHMDQSIPEDQLPIRYVGYSSAFRRESGSYGKDVRGILRVHQFDKVEIESFTTPESARKEQEFIVAIQEYLMQKLGLPYQVVAVCTGDMGGPDTKQIDIETWIPSQNRYRETHSADYVSDYQARRLRTKVRRKDGISELVHMNDATVFAIGRTLIAILENYQQADGSIVIPEVLQPYIGKTVIEARR